MHLELVNERTFGKVVDMKLSEEQNKYVAPNIVSMAQAWLSYEEARPFAVCDGDEVVGFLMLDWDEGERNAGIWRFMIATEYQGKGYGKAALQEAIKMIRESNKFDMINLDFVPGNTVARDLYYSLGFRENGDVEDGEIVMTMPLTDQPKVGMLTADMDDWEDFEELLKAEKEAGTVIPDAMGDEENLKKAIKEKRVKRFTIMAETIGIAVDKELLICSESQERLEEAQERLK